MDWQGMWSGFLQGLANFAGDLVLAALIFLGGWLLARLAARLTGYKIDIKPASHSED